MDRISGAYIEICGVCNAECPYCYNKNLMDKKESLPIAAIKSVFQQLNGIGVNSCTLSGGEPFLYPQLRDVLEEARLLNMKTTVITNGMCFQNGTDLLKQYSPNLQFTFDGFDASSHDVTRGEGNFSRIYEGISKLCEDRYAGKINIRINIHRKNLQHIPEILDMIDTFFVAGKNSGPITGVSAAILHSSDWEDSFHEYLDPSEYTYNKLLVEAFSTWNQTHVVRITHGFDTPDIGCPFNGASGTIECGIRIALDGKVFPCQLFMDERFCIGDIYHDSIDTILQGERFQSFLNDIHSRRTDIEECKACVYQAVCGKGCPAQAYLKYNTLDRVTDLCDSRKRLFAEAIEKAFRSVQKGEKSKVEFF